MRQICEPNTQFMKYIFAMAGLTPENTAEIVNLLADAFEEEREPKLPDYFLRICGETTSNEHNL